MLHSKGFFKYAMMILALGVSLRVWRNLEKPQSSVKSIEQYWSETGLAESQLVDLIDDSTCGSSERYFLACANAVLNIANRYNLQISLDGKVTPAPRFSPRNLSEKQQLEPWKQFFAEQPAAAAKTSFLKIWHLLRDQKVSKAQRSMMISYGLNGFISVFRDPHTYLLPISFFREVVSRTDNQSSSLGLILGRTEQNYFIRKVYPGATSEKMGLKKGDVLLSINGQEISSLLPGRVGELLRGDVGDKVKLGMIRDTRKFEVTLRREQNTLPTVTAKVLDGIKPVGVLTLNKFAKQSCEKTKEALKSLIAQDIRGLMLDLRDNPGGQMEEAACIASLFVGPRQKIYDVRYLNPARPMESTSGEEKKLYSGPMAILINSGSASASEIVAGALQDLNRAILVGERSFGKGSFQEGEVWEQNKNIALFETKGFYYLPSGRSPQMRGLEPDVKVNFKDALQAREVDQYMNPLHAPERGLAKNARARGVSLENCLDIEDSALKSEDPQLGQARTALFCKANVAGVNP